MKQQKTGNWLNLRASVIGGHLMQGIVLLMVVSFIIFSAIQALPGDIAQLMLGKEASAEQIALLREKLGLDEPFFHRYLSWLGNMMTGDFGYSVSAQEPVLSFVGPRIVNSFSIVLLSMAFTVPLAAITGVLAAYWRDSLFDTVTLFVSLIINTLPVFVTGLLLVLLLSTSVFHILPAISVLSPERSLFAQWPSIVLPALTMFLLQWSYLYRLVRASMIDVLSSEYIEFADLKGLSSRRILFEHALPNAVAPAIQAAATVFAFSVGGVVVIEYIFAFPGIGTALTEAVKYRDVEVVQFLVLLIAATFFVSNAIADVISAILSVPSRGEVK